VADQAIEFRFRFLHEPGDDRGAIEAYSNGLADVNTTIIGREPGKFSACLGCSHLKYVEAPSCYKVSLLGGKERIPGCQPIVAADLLYERGTGTCVDLACYLAAARRVHLGERNRVAIEDQGGGMYHAVVVNGVGERFDPQKIALESICHCARGRVAGRIGPVVVPVDLEDRWVVG